MVSLALFSFFLNRLYQSRLKWASLGLALMIALSCLPGLRLKSSLYFSKPRPYYLNLVRAKNIILLPNGQADITALQDYEKAVKYVQSRTKPGEKIYVGSIRHDRICYGDPLFYFLSLTQSSTKYHELYRGIVVSERAQKEMVSELENQKTRIIVLRAFLDVQCCEPNASATPGGSQVLDRYLRAHYAIEREFGNEKILLRVV